MVRRWECLTLAGVLAACGGSRPGEPLHRPPRRLAPAARVPLELPALAPRAPDAAGVDWSAVRWDDDAQLDLQLDVLWRSLGIDAQNWMERVDTIPRDPPELRRAMASFHLRTRRFRCRVATAHEGCAVRAYFLPPATTADLDDDCLGREIAFWALDQLDEADLDGELYRAMVAVIALPGPERELNQRALDKLAPGSWLAENALWEAMAAGNDAFVEANLDRIAPDRLAEAADTYNIDAALLAIDPGGRLPLYLEALDEAEFRDETRLEVAERLVDLASHLDERDGGKRAEIEQAVRVFGASNRADCAAAGVAARMLDDPGSIATRRARTDHDVTRLACLTLHAAGPRGRPWRRLITGHGLTVVRHFVDRFHDPVEWTETETRHLGSFFTLPFAHELERALPYCLDNVCRAPDTGVWFELEIRRERGRGLRIHTIHRHEQLDDEC